MKKIIEEIIQERKRQDEKFGEQNHNPVEWVAILTEEVGEAAKEAVDFHFENEVPKDHPDIIEIQQERLKNYRKELIQVAAVAVQMVESLEKNYYTGKP